jgi:glycosyltransferase involved in cell wall biosynthesis
MVRRGARRHPVPVRAKTVKVAFVFAGNPRLREQGGPADFLYGARELVSRQGWTVSCLQVDEGPADPLTSVIGGRILGRLTPPKTSPEWMSRTRRILPKLRGYDVVVATATELAMGLAVWKSLGLIAAPLVGIMLGAVTFPMTSETRRRVASFLFRRLNVFLFADAEEAELRHRFGIPGERLSVGWFGADELFWVPPRDGRVRSGVLSVGNDGRRDFPTLVRAASMMPEIPFTVITRFEPSGELPPNVRWHCVKFPGREVALMDLLPLYQSAQCVALPLRESIQPSGQSVAMQAMMCGAPVVITGTPGWWGGDVIRDGMEVDLVSPGDARGLAEAIRGNLAKGSVLAARNALLDADWTSRGFGLRLGAFIERISSSE